MLNAGCTSWSNWHVSHWFWILLCPSIDIFISTKFRLNALISYPYFIIYIVVCGLGIKYSKYFYDFRFKMCFQYSEFSIVYRGEKLYVTKDKRLKPNWRKKVFWSIGLALLALALLIGILAACMYFAQIIISMICSRHHQFMIQSIIAGIIGEKEEPIDAPLYNENNVNAAGVFGAGGSRSRNNQSEYPLSPEPPRSTVPAHPPTTDENQIFVSNSLNGQFKIVNMEYKDDLSDHDGTAYLEMAKEVENGLKEAIGQDDVSVKVLNLR